MTALLLVAIGALAVLCILVSPRVRSSEGFFRGISETGRAPGLWPLVFSQVTTWIFARSLLNAAILGYLFGIAGTIAYGSPRWRSAAPRRCSSPRSSSFASGAACACRGGVMAPLSPSAGSVVYFLDSAGNLPVMAHLFGPLHDYTRLLIVNVAVLTGGCAAFAFGILGSRPQPRRADI